MGAAARHARPRSSATSTSPRRSPPTRSATALQRWPVDGVPHKPAAWLLTTARHRAVDLLRRDRNYAARLARLQVEADRAERRYYVDAG